MKKSIFTLGLIAASFTLANATEITNTDPVKDANKTEVTNNADVIYVYTVVTEERVINGTADTMAEVKQIMSNIDVDIVSKNVTPLALDLEDSDRLYVWGVATNDSNASGVAKSKTQAEKMIKLMSVGDVVDSKILEAYDTKK